MNSERFFDESGEQSLVKTGIVSKYFWSWAKVINSIDWVIVGGESGPGARSMLPAWITVYSHISASGEVQTRKKQVVFWMDALGVRYPLKTLKRLV